MDAKIIPQEKMGLHRISIAGNFEGIHARKQGMVFLQPVVKECVANCMYRIADTQTIERLERIVKRPLRAAYLTHNAPYGWSLHLVGVDFQINKSSVLCGL
ncbi:MAG: hypothetical protein LUD69_01645 [Oscillospiraceae bacterium]|nr:hypothetical protein [Oscillospiraceae bacterium]